MLAEVVDAVIGIDTHRDSHEVEIADAAGKPIAAMRIGNHSSGFAQLLAAITKVAPGPRVAVCIEGSRSYGIGLARALAAAGLLVIECEQPGRKQRRGKGKSDPIDAHLAVLTALRPRSWSGTRRRPRTSTRPGPERARSSGELALGDRSHALDRLQRNALLALCCGEDDGASAGAHDRAAHRLALRIQAQHRAGLRRAVPGESDGADQKRAAERCGDNALAQLACGVQGLGVLGDHLGGQLLDRDDPRTPVRRSQEPEGAERAGPEGEQQEDADDDRGWVVERRHVGAPLDEAKADQPGEQGAEPVAPGEGRRAYA